MAFDPIVASTTRVADHREPRRHLIRTLASLESFRAGIREHLHTFRDYPPKRVV